VFGGAYVVFHSIVPSYFGQNEFSLLFILYGIQRAFSSRMIMMKILFFQTKTWIDNAHCYSKTQPRKEKSSSANLQEHFPLSYQVCSFLKLSIILITSKMERNFVHKGFMSF